MKKHKLSSETSFDDLADELLNEVKPKFKVIKNLSHGDNSEVLQIPQSDITQYHSIGKKLNEEWRP